MIGITTSGFLQFCGKKNQRRVAQQRRERDKRFNGRGLQNWNKRLDIELQERMDVLDLAGDSSKSTVIKKLNKPENDSCFDVEPDESAVEEKATKLKMSLEEKGINITQHGARHAVRDGLEKDLYEYLKPLLDIKEHLLQIIEINGEERTPLSNIAEGKDYIIQQKNNTGRIVVEEKEKDILIVFDDKMNDVVTVYKKINLKDISQKEKEKYFRRAIEKLQLRKRVHLAENEKQILINKCIELQKKLLTKDIGMSWQATTEACYEGFAAEDIPVCMNKAIKSGGIKNTSKDEVLLFVKNKKNGKNFRFRLSPKDEPKYNIYISGVVLKEYSSGPINPQNYVSY